MEGKIKQNISNLIKEIKMVCKKCNRSFDEIKIVAASKYANTNQILEAFYNGIQYFGENRTEELLEKYSVIKNKVNWHFIGHLQSRKVKKVVPIVELIHSVDSIKLLEKINLISFQIGKIQDVLIEVNLSGESTKFGINEDEIDFFLKNSVNFKNIRITGLMTMAPLSKDFTLIRSIFRKLRTLLQTYMNVPYSKDFSNILLKELSMGMSNDYKIAIEEGASIIRIGSLIFL